MDLQENAHFVRIYLRFFIIKYIQLKRYTPINKIVIFFLVIGLSICFTTPVLGYSGGADIHLIVKELHPVPAEPGDDLVVSMTIENQDSKKADNLTIEIIPDPIIILKDENERYIKTELCGYCKMAKTYHLYVDSQANSGVYEIEIKTLADGVGKKEIIDVIIYGEPHLTLCNTSISPDFICPGDNMNLLISVCNKGTGSASCVSVSSIIKNPPFAPIGTNTLIVEQLSPGDSEELEFNFLINNNAKPASYLIPIRIDYKSEKNKNSSTTEVVGVNVRGEAKLSIAGITTDPSRIKKKDNLLLMIRIENTGTGDANSVKAHIDIPLKGTKTAFLGKIEPDEDAPALFNLYASDDGECRYNVTIQYDDDQGTHEIYEKLEVSVYRDNNTLIFIAGLLIFGSVFVYWFFLRK